MLILQAAIEVIWFCIMLVAYAVCIGFALKIMIGR